MINYKQPGDAVEPEGPGLKVICHICNDSGKWGKGFVVAVSKKFPKAEQEYRAAGSSLALGSVQFVEVAPDIVVANMIAQRDIFPLKDGSAKGCPPLRYDALYECLIKVGAYAASKSASIHAPKFGAGLAGGKWEIIECLVEKVFVKDFSLQVTIYEPDII